jgi:bloom syndrome protein
VDHATKKAGLSELKVEQRKVLHQFVSGRDVFVALPTGYGKSFCYALLPAVFDHLRSSNEASIVICVSPLTALMMEQRAKFTVRGISTDFVGELQQDVDAMEGVKKGNIQLLFISPESLLSNPQWREMLLSPVYQKNLVALIVDEAHCVTQW